MRHKIVPSQVRKDILECRPASFCPFIHFETAWRALEHVNNRAIGGDVVLCGVATGGLAKFMLRYLGSDRRLWLYDMFDGGTLPGPKDSDFDRSIGEHVKAVMATSADRVKAFVDDGTDRCVWVVGDVMKTLPEMSPTKISVLYLDTDWHDSTLHELKCLEPLVSPGGIIIQDDMGLCRGAASAVLSYYNGKPPFIVPMDEAGSVWVKQ